MDSREQKTHEATKRIMQDRLDYEHRIEGIVALLREDVSTFDERMRLTSDRVLFLEKERLPQIETSLKNTTFSLDIQRDALTRVKDHVVQVETCLDLQTKQILEA